MKTINFIDAVFSAMPDQGAFIFNSDLVYVFACGELLNRLGYSDMVGKRIDQVISPSSMDKIKPYYISALNGEYRVMKQFRSADTGEVYEAWFFPYKHVSKSTNKAYNLGVGVVRQITEYVRLQEQEARGIRQHELFKVASTFGAKINLLVLDMFVKVQNMIKDNPSQDLQEIKSSLVKQLDYLADLHMIGGQFMTAPQKTNLRDFIEPKAKGFNLKFIAPIPVFSMIDHPSFSRALELLFKNVSEFGDPSTGKVELSIEKGKPKILISNKFGGVITEDPKAFFYSSKGRLGLGLNIAEVVIEKNQGRLEVLTNKEYFTVCIILEV